MPLSSSRQTASAVWDQECRNLQAHKVITCPQQVVTDIRALQVVTDIPEPEAAAAGAGAEMGGY